jgi:putative PIN family toxin of toxin-antitoxin system
VLRLVLDTHVWLDWLVFEDKDTAPIRNAVALKTAAIFIDAACEAELERVLGYPFGKKTLDVERQKACLAQCRRLAGFLNGNLSREDKSSLPLCRDPDDQKFLEAALMARADMLVTKDRALLELARRKTRALPFRIVTPEAFSAKSASEP